MDAAPLHGALLLQATLEKEFARWGAASFIEAMTHLPEPKGEIWITADALYGVFLEFTGVDPDAFEKCEFGLEVACAVDQGRLPFVKADRIHAGRIYRGLDPNTLGLAVDTYEQHQKAHGASA